MKIWLCTIAIRLLVDFSTSQSCSAQVTVRIGVEKQRYLVGEKICIEETRTNEWSHAVNVPGYVGSSDRHDILLIDEHGIRVPCHVRFENHNGLMLGSRERVTHVVALDYWGKEPIPFGTRKGLAAGRYHLSIRVDDRMSNTVRFEVVEPVGEEARLFRSAKTVAELKDRQAKYTALRAILEGNPKTVYASVLHGDLQILEQANPRKEGIEWHLRYAQRFPSTWYASIAATLYVSNRFARFLLQRRGLPPQRGGADSVFAHLEAERVKLRGTRAGAAIEEQVREYRAYLAGQGY